MKLSTLLLIWLVILAPASLSANDCRDAAGKIVDRAGCTGGEKKSPEPAPPKGSQSLPKDAQAQVEDLRVHMRFFMAIGFHDKAQENRDAIAAIYQQHGVATPAEFLTR